MSNTDGLEELRRLVAAFPEELPSLSARGGALVSAWKAEREQAAELAEAHNFLMTQVAEARSAATAYEQQAAADRAALAQAHEALAEDREKCSFDTALYVGALLLAKVYPENVFTGASGDPGPTYIAALRDALLTYAQRNELAQARHANDTERGEWSRIYALLSGSDNGTWSAADMERAIEAKLSALAQARALAEEWITGDGETYGAKLLAEAGRRLKSMLGGAR